MIQNSGQTANGLAHIRLWFAVGEKAIFEQHSGKRNSGFTLTELLIALGILGIIATFVIPKLLYVSQMDQKKAILKETLAALSEATNLFCISSDTSTNPVPYTYMTSKINAQKLCPNNSSTEGCIGASASTEITEPGFVMHNGASVAGLRGISAPRDVIVLDWNGSDGANVLGDDQMSVAINFTQNSLYNGVARCRVGPYSPNAPSVTMYQALYTN